MKLVVGNLPSVQNDDWRAWYSGVVYSPGFAAGDTSVRNFLDTISASTLKDEAHKLKGNYFVAVENISTRAWWLFCDMSGMAPLFYTKQWASPSIRTLIHHESGLTADRIALLEFLLAGLYDRSAYPVESVQRIKGEEILYGAPDTAPAIIGKEISGTQISDERAFVQSMGELSSSFSGMKLSLDLTAGWDSRLNLATLVNGAAEIESSLAAFEDHPDAIIARRVAGRVGTPFYLMAPKKDEEVTDHVLRSIVSAGDGLFADLEAMDRKSDLMKDRIARNVALSVDGTGGELYKDFWWLQDFPFYGSRRANIPRLIATRVHLEKLEAFQLTPRATSELRQASEQIHTRMEGLRADTNIQTYDKIYRERMYGLSGQLSAAVTRSTGMPTYSPYLEDCRARFASRLPITDRMFDTFQRRIVAERLPETRDIPTDKGTYSNDSSVSSVIRYGRMLGGRAINKMWQVQTGERLVELKAPGNKAAYLNAIVQSSLWQDAVGSLVRNDIINDASSLDESSYKAVTRLLIIATILEDLDGVGIVELPEYESIIELGTSF